MKFIFLVIVVLLISCEQKTSYDRINESVTYLASDELKGRGTGTEGEVLAANYIIKRLKEVGLEPLNGSYLVPFKYNGKVELGSSNSVTIENNSLKLYEDFRTLGYSSSDTKENSRAVFAGYGILSKEFNFNSIPKNKMKNSVLFVVDGFPESDNPHRSMKSIGTRRNKLRMARDNGASAIVFLVDSVSSFLKENHVQIDAGLPAFEMTYTKFDELFSISKSATNTYASKEMYKPLKSKISFSAEVKRLELKPNNIVAVKEGKNKDQFIVIGAHYDHLGIGLQSGAYDGNQNQIHNGADDNASGTSAVIEVANMLKNIETNATIVYQLYSGEELGLLGSKALVEQNIIENSKIKAMINLDMVGRLEKEKGLTVYGTKTGVEFDTLLTQLEDQFKFGFNRVPNSPGNSDHASFYQKNIPVIFFNTSLHGDYHKPSDDADKINIKGIVSISKLTARLTKLIDDQNTITFNRVKEEKKQKVSPFRVYIGTFPDYAYQGKGLKITGTSPKSPAEKAGMKAGDIMTNLNGKKIETIYDYMGVLGELNPNKQIPMSVKRDGKELKLKITPTKK